MASSNSLRRRVEAAMVAIPVKLLTCTRARFQRIVQPTIAYQKIHRSLDPRKCHAGLGYYTVGYLTSKIQRSYH